MQMRAAIYVRVSSLHETQDTSIENQEELLIREVENRGWVLVDTYRERESGTTFERGEMKRLLQDAAEKNFDILLTKSISRFGRNQRELLEAIEILDANDIRFIEFEKNIDTAKDRTLLGLYAWLAENESRQKSESIKLTMRSKQKNGDFIGARCPYGYRRDTANKNKLVIAEDITTETVRRIYDLYIKGYGYRAIAAILTDERIPPPEPEMYNRKSDAWNFQTIKTILSSQYYLGHVEQHKQENMAFKKGKKRVKKEDWIVVENCHEPIISKEQYELVQNIMTKRGGSYRRKGDTVHLFSGFLTCGQCGSNLLYMKGTYVCRLYVNSGVGYCTRHGIKESELIDIIRQDLWEFSQGKISVEDMVQEAKKHLFKNQTKLEKQLSEAQKEKVRLERQLVNAYQDRLEEVITIEQYKSISKSFDERKSLLEKRIVELEGALTREKKEEDKIPRLKGQIEEILGFETLDRMMLEKLIDKIIVHEDDKEKKLDIYYHF